MCVCVSVYVTRYEHVANIMKKSEEILDNAKKFNASVGLLTTVDDK